MCGVKKSTLQLFMNVYYSDELRHLISSNNNVLIYLVPKAKTKTKLRGFGPRANYTDRATAACWQSSANFLRIKGVMRSA
jgi:hypothetical protein